MSNKTVSGAKFIRGVDPQRLLEKIIRERIYDSLYWKEECFGLTIDTLIDKALQLKYIGGTIGGTAKPLPFLCLLLKMLQLSPDEEIVDVMISHPTFKYLRILSALYYRLTCTNSLAIYKKLEPLMKDHRKIIYRDNTGKYSLTFVDEVIDSLLNKERVFDIILPHLTKRQIFVEEGELCERKELFRVELGDGMLNDFEEKEKEELQILKEIDTSKDGENETVKADHVESLSIEETNALRAKLGLKPLEI